jgi:predicted dehydrogenase
VVFGFLRFPSGLAAHLHLSWLDPHKERRFTVVGSRRMATFDDMDLERKVTVYDKGFDERVGSYGEYITRSGDIWSPQVPAVEPLRIECEHFVECVRDGRAPTRTARRRARGAGARGAAAVAGCHRERGRCCGSPRDAVGLVMGEGVELGEEVRFGAMSRSETAP